ncbi:hypothetical protein [Serratia sp. 1D1416]|uniref:hypothetical protein n=1 Tax=Serratia sp. 1D1416 TaxID=2447890 RepID=UPI001013C8BD|nr:hypothetical protein [Serratia sp. 1D1416]
MKLPPYLIILLIMTLGLLMWGMLSDDVQEEPILSELTEPKVYTLSNIQHKKNKEAHIVDLFPVRKMTGNNAKEIKTPQPERKKELIFPLKVVGGWWESGKRIIVLSDTERNFLLCRECQGKDYIQPGKMIIPDWQLNILADDHLVVESTSSHIKKRIELGDLTTKPT